MILLLALILMIVAWGLLVSGLGPAPTWFYVLAWYPTLVVLDRLATRRLGGKPLLRFDRCTASLFAWSPVVWLAFEAANFRLRNWYYVFLPANGVERWAGILLSFATVVPAIVLAERLLAAYGVGTTWHGRAVVVTRRDVVAAAALGAGMLGVSLAWPRTFFPLVWGGVWLLLDPIVLRRTPEHSLFGDLARGEWGRIGRLMLGGLAIGLLWESYNFWARGKWIYTVPWLEHTKLFEMPPLGFLGFPIFALEAWTMYHTLVAIGVARAPGASWNGPRSTPPRRRVWAAAVLGVALSTAVLLGMEHWTISSVTPRLEELPRVPPEIITRLREAHVRSPFDLRGRAPRTLGRAARIGTAQARRAIDAAGLVTLRGIGTTHAATLQDVGVRGICQLASRQPESLLNQLGEVEPSHAPRRLRPTLAEVRVWIGAARRACPPRGEER